MLNRLFQLKQELQTTKQKGIAVDIDETLSWTVGYWFREMSQKFGNPQQLSPSQLIEEYKYTFNVPYWQKAEAEAWIEHKRHSNKLQTKLEIIPGADEYLQRINKLHPVRAYITARPESVTIGTKQWLATHGFPTAPVITKPNFVGFNSNNQWRARVLEFLYPEIEIFIDDNVGLIHHLSSEYRGKVILYGTDQPVNSDINVAICPTWKDVYEALS